jgi:Protein of unknown function (DUF4238)
MALDHNVSQVHLKNFYSPALAERMYAVRKSDGKAFTPNAESVCRIEEGSTNAYLTKDRAIEDFLTGVEPKYNASVKKLSSGEVDAEAIYVVAGFTSYILTCSPTAMRLQAAPLKAMLESSARALDAAGAFPALPEALSGASLTELLGKGALTFKVDPKFPQAIGITNILRMVLTFGNSAWEILRNPFADSPFFTSDFPAAVEPSADPRVVNRIVPLTPSLAVRLCPDISLDRDRLDFGFRQFRYRAREIGREELGALNRLLVRCAEDLVFYRDDYPWVKPFISKHAGYHVETRTQELNTEGGAVLISQQKVVQRQ